MKRQIETNITIDAAPERVWSVLTDFARMPNWNPFIKEISGRLESKSRLSVRIVPPGKAAMTFKPTLLVVRVGRELRWLGSLPIPGLFEGEHFFLLQPEASNKTYFVQGEIFRGLLVGMLAGNLDSTQAGFNAMNEALKVEAEKG